MRDRWLEEHVGSEAIVSPEFESSLGETLQSAWPEPLVSTSAVTTKSFRYVSA